MRDPRLTRCRPGNRSYDFRLFKDAWLRPPRLTRTGVGPTSSAILHPHRFRINASGRSPLMTAFRYPSTYRFPPAFGRFWRATRPQPIEVRLTSNSYFRNRSFRLPGKNPGAIEQTEKILWINCGSQTIFQKPSYSCRKREGEIEDHEASIHCQSSDRAGSLSHGKPGWIACREFPYGAMPRAYRAVGSRSRILIR